MNKSELSPTEVEALAIKRADKRSRAELNPNDPENFNIVRGRPLPEGFVNKPLGKEGRFCLDTEGRYNPEWSQLKIDKIRDKQRDPQSFPLIPKRYGIPLDTWVDAPPEVIISLQDAIETHYDTTYTDDSVTLGVHPKVVPRERKRFFWDMIKSA